MSKLIFRYSNGEEISVDAEVGRSVMAAATASGIDGIVAECGGNAMCATCHVYVSPDLLDIAPAMADDEDEMLEFVVGERRDGSRLSCQITVTEDMNGTVIELPERQQ